jgi:hypothetical protein
MARLPLEQVQFHDEMIAGATPDYDLWDAAGLAVEDTFRRSPIAAVGRQIQAWTDNSVKLDAMDANERFGLTGTEAAFRPDDTDITEERAKTVAADYHRLRKHDYITDLVNEESPILGRMTQFAASMGASLLDPSLMAANIGGSMLIGKGIAALAKAAPAINGIARVSPTAARGIMRMYDHGVRKSISEVMVREGLENFAGSIIEETVNFTGVGEEQLARKVSAQESLMNIVASTTLGGGLGTLISKDGRKALARKFGRDYGDDAAEVLKSSNLVTEMELNLGLPRSQWEFKMLDHETFTPRPWHDQKYQYRPLAEHTNQKMYIPVDEDGAVHTISHRGAGTVLTDNITQAYNKGTKVIEVDTGNLRILDDSQVVDVKGRTTKVGKQVIKGLVDDLANNTDLVEASRALAVLKGMDPETAPRLNRNQLKSELTSMMDGKGIDDIIKVLDDVGTRSRSAYDHTKKLNEIIEQLGFNGYHYVGKNSAGQPAYNGIYVHEKFARKITKSTEIESPNASKANFHQKETWKLEQQKLFEAYDDYVQKNRGKLTDTVTPAKESPDDPPNEIEQKELATREDHAKLSEQIKAKEAAAKTKAEPAKEGEPAPKASEPEQLLSEQEYAMMKYSEARAAGKTMDDLAKEETDAILSFFGCMKG